MNVNNFLLVGGFGFLGRHLILHLKERGGSFTVITRKEPLPPWNQNDFILSSALDAERMKELANTHEVLVYMASSSIPGSSTLVNELDSNVRPAVEFINTMTDFNPELKIIYLSSGGQIYGNAYTAPMRESDDCHPVSPYAYGKLLIEQSLAFMHRQKKIHVVILRVANPVGCWQTGSRQGLVNVVMQAVKHDKPVTIFGTGHEVRDYIDADDVALIIDKIGLSPFSYDIFNIGSGVAVATIEIIEMIENLVGKRIEKKYLDRRPVDPEYAVLNCDKVFKQYGWLANKGIFSIMSKTLESKTRNNLI